MRVGSVFSGYCDGFGLAATWVSWQVIWQIEIKKKAHKYLKQNFPNAKRYYDVKDCGAGGRTNRLAPVDILLGGDPCQPHSSAGQRRGQDDDRFLWPEYFRLVKDLRPRWLVNENVDGSISNGTLDKKIADLESEGYACQAYHIPAVAFNAVHRRPRIWLVAYLDAHGLGQRNDQQHSIWAECPSNIITGPERTAGAAPDTMQEQRQTQWDSRGYEASRKLVSEDWRTIEPTVGRGIYGIPNRVAQIEGLGDAIVPHAAYFILYHIDRIEKLIKQQ